MVNDLIIENYKSLIKAIYNCDMMDERLVKYYVCVYDMKENEKLIAVFGSYGWCAKFFDISVNSIQFYANKGLLRNKRYLIKKVAKETLE